MKTMLAQATDWAVVALGIVVVIGTVLATFVLIARFLRNPTPSRPRRRRGSGQFDPPSEEGP